ncbi:pyruvate kinase-like [Melitaea cinxia]|uniref:pyruvate kinase-like n=1 Tax=Melitaea cinxia TaxID=113334 RepID=UPI001E26F3B8|nr:pyruvate kinase-like [Melitaea cinxia]
MWLKNPETIYFKDIDFSNKSVLKKPPFRIRRCPVIITLADSHITAVDIQKLLEAGMNVAKFKMSSSTRGDKIRLLGKIDKAAQACSIKYNVTDWPVASCIELKTCVVKTGLLEFDSEFITLEKNSEVILTYNISYFNKCNAERIFVDNHFLVNDVTPGTEISLAADEIILKCIGIVDDKSIKCVITKGGKLSNLCSVCTRHAKHSRPFITKKDTEIIKFALEYQIDTIIINYVRHPDTIKKIKHLVRALKIKRPFILCGICTEEGLVNIDEILKETDGLILSREYLPYEIEKSQQYRLTQIQKWVAGKCLQAGKPLYISGGVFEHALKTGHFIDSEISDMTNALMDGVSGFILKECYNTDIMVDVLKGINELCYAIEPLTISKTNFRRIIKEIKMPVNAAEAAVISCVTAANQTNSRVIIVPTVSGKTIRLLHWLRPSSIVITISTNIRVLRHLRNYRSVMPILYKGEQHNKWEKNLSARVLLAVEYAVEKSWLLYGDTYVILQRGSEFSSFCDAVTIWNVTISNKPLVGCADNEDNPFVSNTYLE